MNHNYPIVLYSSVVLIGALTMEIVFHSGRRKFYQFYGNGLLKIITNKLM